MRRIGLVLLASAVLVGTAFAADLPPRMYTKAPIAPAPYNWTGLYVGGNIGYSWGRTSTDYTTVGAGTETHSDSINMNGVIGGGQIGYNYQFNKSYLLGIEGDFQFSGEKGSNTLPICTTIGASACDTTTTTESYTEKLKWFGTVRGRLGFLPDPRWLVYGTGGWAVGRLTRDETYSYAGGGGGPPFANSFSGTKSGWTVGAGVEAALWDKWTLKAEYLYLRLAGLGTTVVSFPNTVPATVTTTVSHAFTDNIVRVGLNYRFGTY